MRLLPPDGLVKTSDVDHADWNYRPVLSFIQRTRFRLVMKLLPDGNLGDLLEVGYGSGVFMPELDARSNSIAGIDPHEKHKEVQHCLAGHGIEARLASGSVTELPFADGSFNGAVSVSAIEYVDDIDRACAELTRVLRPNGFFVLVTPGQSPLIDTGLKLLTGESAEENYSNRREALVPALRSWFEVERELSFPRGFGKLVKLYSAFRLRRK